MEELPSLRQALSTMVRRRVPEHETDDIVQATLTDAWAATDKPSDPEAFRKWVWGIARHKIADFYRKSRRLEFDVPDTGVEPAQHAEWDLLRWATDSLPDGENAKETLSWLLREGDGEKLEDIAESAKIPAPRVRKRVSRMREHLRAHWKKEAAVLLAMGIVLAIYLALTKIKEDVPIVRDVPQRLREDNEHSGRLAKADKLRRDGLSSCDRGEWTMCLARLNEAREFDLPGDSTESVVKARREAEVGILRELAPAPTGGPSDVKLPHKPTPMKNRSDETPTEPFPKTQSKRGSSGP